MATASGKIKNALDFIRDEACTETELNSQWSLDRVVFLLTGSETSYNKFVKEYNLGEDGPNTYEWPKGEAP